MGVDDYIYPGLNLSELNAQIAINTRYSPYGINNIYNQGNGFNVFTTNTNPDAEGTSYLGIMGSSYSSGANPTVFPSAQYSGYSAQHSAKQASFAGLDYRNTFDMQHTFANLVTLTPAVAAPVSGAQASAQVGRAQQAGAQQQEESPITGYKFVKDKNGKWTVEYQIDGKTATAAEYKKRVGIIAFNKTLTELNKKKNEAAS